MNNPTIKQFLIEVEFAIEIESQRSLRSVSDFASLNLNLSIFPSPLINLLLRDMHIIQMFNTFAPLKL